MPADVRNQLQATLSGSYTLERELGGGGMSRVFVAEETRLGRKVVVKVLSSELAASVSAERFEREIKVAASLQQANIVPVLSAGDAGGLPYYTMPFVEGRSVRARLADGPFSITQAVGILKDVARALSYAHEHGVVHRDIKPDNVLISGGAAVVTDFGIAKAISASRTGPGAGTLTQIGTSIGTPAYMAPEQAAGDPDVDHRADIYAFGCLAYELLAGRSPFYDRTPQRMLAAHMNEMPAHVTELHPDVPQALGELVMRCLAKDRDERMQSASDVLHTLDTMTSAGTHAAMPSILIGGPGMLRKALLLYAGAFVVVAILARAAIVAIGLPDWVFPGALIVMALGLPVILFTAYVHHVTRQIAMITSPTITPGGTPSHTQGTLAQIAVKASPHVSWRRATMGGVYAMGAFAVLTGAFMTLRALGIGPAGTLLAAGKLSGREALLVTDFRVNGSDSSLAGVVSEAVRTDLAQSSVVSIVPPASITAALQRMQRPGASHLDLDLAREIALREGIKAIVDGDVRQVGRGYIVTLRLVGADSAQELASYRATADGTQELLDALDKLTRRLRGKIGESLRKVHADPPLDRVTTSSLEALRKYAAGVRANDSELDFAKAMRLLQEAVALDSTFAMAWRKLAVNYNNARMPRAQIDFALQRAYQYRDRLTDVERYLTTAYYFSAGPGRNRGKAIAAYETVLERDPSDYPAYNNIAVQLNTRRDWARADSILTHAMQSGIESGQMYANIANAKTSLGKFDEALATLARGRQRFPTATGFDGTEENVLYSRGQVDSARARLSGARSWPNAQRRATGLNMLGGLEVSQGRLVAGARLSIEAGGINAARGSPHPASYDSLMLAWQDIWFRERASDGVRQLDATLAAFPMQKLPVDQRQYFEAAMLYAHAGRPDRARAVLSQYQSDVRDSVLRTWFAPQYHTALAEVLLAEHKPLEAIKEFQVGDLWPDGPATACAICLHARLGRAFDAAGMPDSAIAHFTAFLESPYTFRLEPAADPENLAGVHKRLGELHEAKGDRARATTHYIQFVDLWKNADPELQPKVAQVRQRLARLKDLEARK